MPAAAGTPFSVQMGTLAVSWPWRDSGL